MYTYKLPPIKKRKGSKEAIATVENDDYERSMRLPVNEDILNAVVVGDKVEIMLTGEIVETGKQDALDHKSRNITIKVSQIDAYPEDEKKAMAEGKKGFKKGYKKY